MVAFKDKDIAPIHAVECTTRKSGNLELSKKHQDLFSTEMHCEPQNFDIRN